MRAWCCLLCLILVGCGLKGDLYLPEEPLEAGSATAGDSDSAVTEPVPPRLPEPDDAIKGTDEFDDRRPEDPAP